MIAGNIRDTTWQKAKELQVSLIDIMQREELTILNTTTIAEGAAEIAIREAQRTIHDSNILVIGFDVLGIVIANTLKGIGAQVWGQSENKNAVAWMKTFHYTPYKEQEGSKTLQKFDVIINTKQQEVLGEKELRQVKKECVLIDLVSAPGGINKEVAKRLKLKLIWEPSLHAKVAPNTTAQYIKDTILNILKEQLERE